VITKSHLDFTRLAVLSQNLADRFNGLVGFLIQQIVESSAIGLSQGRSSLGDPNLFFSAFGSIPTGSRCDGKQEGNQIGVLQLKPPRYLR